MSWFRRRRPVEPSVRDECECERIANRVRQMRDAEGEPQSPGFQWARSCPNSFPSSDGSAAPVGSSEQPPRSLSPFGLPGSSQPGDDVVVRGGFDLNVGCDMAVSCRGCGRTEPCPCDQTEG